MYRGVQQYTTRIQHIIEVFAYLLARDFIQKDYLFDIPAAVVIELNMKPHFKVQNFTQILSFQFDYQSLHPFWNHLEKRCKICRQ
jgi:hypothetical protein